MPCVRGETPINYYTRAYRVIDAHALHRGVNASIEKDVACSQSSYKGVDPRSKDTDPAQPTDGAKGKGVRWAAGTTRGVGWRRAWRRPRGEGGAPGLLPLGSYLSSPLTKGLFRVRFICAS